MISYNSVKNIFLELLEMNLERIVEESQCCPFGINNNLWKYIFKETFKLKKKIYNPYTKIHYVNHFKSIIQWF